MVPGVSNTRLRVVERADAVGWRSGTTTYMHAGEAVGAEQLCVFEQLHEPGGGAPSHRHPGFEEAVTILAGQARFEVEGKVADVEAVATVIVPAGAEHAFTNVGDEPLWVIASMPAAVAAVEYSAEPGVVLEIARAGGKRHDGHRAYKDG